MDKTTPAPRVVRCPACGGDSIYAATNPYRPFCSERCKNMDFGAWASETWGKGVLRGAVARLFLCSNGLLRTCPDRNRTNLVGIALSNRHRFIWSSSDGRAQDPA